MSLIILAAKVYAACFLLGAAAAVICVIAIVVMLWRGR
jgi:hypothetical protein